MTFSIAFSSLYAGIMTETFMAVVVSGVFKKVRVVLTVHFF